MKTIIFDFDGTIADTLPYTLDKMMKVVREFGIVESEKKLEHDFRSKGMDQLRQEYKISLLQLPKIFLKIRQAQKELIKVIDQINLCPGMKEMLLKLRSQGVTLGIVSSNLKENVAKFLKKHNLLFFDFIHCETNIFGKASAIKNLIKKYRFDKEEVVYVGDEVRDIEACKAAEVKIISVTWGLNSKEILEKYQPDWLVGKPEEIIEIIKSF